eukprot:CAMPEP_0168356810 /NCGR_PEP_ID=MMETSP0228-20121227/253_1 /TAXON_ID=133427 /ORGANISM="Protoceratium reticulatum, Strain CCCM 535 (=CCMP 1889)" /LENGTH=77 /DNA_ID=CAMNT_0008369289 /DNA_START=564 /DNA_END=797 /DNA_ORIENTATION=+
MVARVSQEPAPVLSEVGQRESAVHGRRPPAAAWIAQLLAVALPVAVGVHRAEERPIAPRSDEIPPEVVESAFAFVQV